MKHKIILFVLLLSSNALQATNFHFSPELKIGPYIGSGISGGGLQLGVSDKLGMDAIYFSYSHTSAEFIGVDKDRLKTYRVGTQYQLVQNPKISLQLEAGAVDYEGSRRNIFTGENERLSSVGFSSAAAFVIFINDHVGFRSGIDINYINNSNTFLSYPLSATYSAGIVLHF